MSNQFSTLTQGKNTPIVHSALEKTAREELAKFFQVTMELDETAVMFSEYVDSIWHKMLENPEEYALFCLEACEKVVGHLECNGSGKILWVGDYEAKFGQLDSIWFMDENGVLDINAYNTYLKQGTVYGSWRCSRT